VESTATTAIPGALLTKLIADVNGKDKEKQKAAQEMLASMGKLTAEEPMELSVFFGCKPNKRLRVDVFRGPTISRVHAEEHFRGLSGNLTDVKNKLSSPLSDAQVRSRIEESLDEVLRTVAGTPVLVPVYKTPTPFDAGGPVSTGGVVPVWSSPLHPACTGDCSNVNYTASLVTKRGSAAEGLKSALRSGLLAATESQALPQGDAEVRMPFNLIDARQVVFVCVKEEDFQLHRHDPEFKVGVRLHGKGNPSVPSDEVRPRYLQPIDFPDDQVITSARPSEGKMRGRYDIGPA
jgi:hypothetical protein